MKLNKRLQIALLIIGCAAIVVGILWLIFHHSWIALSIFVVFILVGVCWVDKENKEWKKFQEKED